MPLPLEIFLWLLEIFLLSIIIASFGPKIANKIRPAQGWPKRDT